MNGSLRIYTADKHATILRQSRVSSAEACRKVSQMSKAILCDIFNRFQFYQIKLKHHYSSQTLPLSKSI